MNKTILQVPIDKSTRDQAALAAFNLGFSSLQEPVRLFLKELSTGNLRVKFEPKAIQLSPKAIKRYDKMTEDIASGKVKLYEAKDVDDLMGQLAKL